MNKHLYCRRQAWLVAVLIIGFVVAVCASTLAAPPDLQSMKGIQILQETNAVDVYDYLEVTVRPNQPVSGNPFTDVLVEGEFSQVKDGTSVKVEGFCDSQDGSSYKI
jgi:Domain of unknown function (DUF5060)